MLYLAKYVAVLKPIGLNYLSWCKVAKERPPDPIQYVADYLHGKAKTEKDSPSAEKSKISPPTSPNKIASQNNEPDSTNEDKNTHQNGILEENGRQSRLDDFKVNK